MSGFFKIPPDSFGMLAGILISVCLIVIGWHLRSKPKLRSVGWIVVALGLAGILAVLGFFGNH